MKENGNGKYRMSEKSVHLLEVGYRGCTYGYSKCWKWSPRGWEYVTKSRMSHKAYVWDWLNHGYRFTTLLAGVLGLFAHPVHSKHKPRSL
jgi:hypothetical protein